MDVLFALKLLVGVFAFGAGLVLGSLFAAIWLRLAAYWMKFGDVPFLTAFKSALMANFVVSTLNFSIGVNHGMSTAILRQMSDSSRQRPFDFSFAYSPTHYLYVTLFGLLITAAIFRRTIPQRDAASPTADGDSRISFWDAMALASLYFAISFAFTVILVLLTYCILAGILDWESSTGAGR